MARKKINKIKIENDDIRSMLKKPAVWVGLATVILVMAIGGNLVKGRINKILNQKQTTIISPKPSAEKVTPKLSPKVKTITKFANTNGYYQVEEGDSYALISEKICGSQQWFEQIAFDNGYKPLSANDLITVNCGE